MDWESLERRPKKQGSDEKKNDEASFKIPVKKVAVSPDKVRKLPDGTIVVIDDDKSPRK